MKFPVKTTHPSGPESLALIRKLESARCRVADRARELFMERGCADGHELDDWLTAEQELYNVPKAEMKETANGIQIRVAVPGFEAGQLKVSALPGILAVEGYAEAEQKNDEMKEKREEKVVFSEINDRQLFRRFLLPRPVKPEAMRATLENGLLTITVPKAEPMSEAERLAIEAKMLMPRRSVETTAALAAAS